MGRRRDGSRGGNVSGQVVRVGNGGCDSCGHSFLGDLRRARGVRLLLRTCVPPGEE